MGQLLMTTTFQKTDRTTAGLRDALFDALDDLNSGKRSPTDILAVCRVAAEIINSVGIEIEFFKNVSKVSPNDVPSTVLSLSGRKNSDV